MKKNMIIILVIIFLVIITNDYIKSKAAVYMQSENINNNGLNTMKIKYFPETRYELRKLVCNESIKLWEIDTSKITDMHNLFYQSERKDFTGIEDWNVSNVKDMSHMFEYAVRFNQDIGSWDISNVRNISWMFAGAKQFNQDIGNWNTENVKDMNRMFLKTVNFNQDISRWNVSNVEDMFCMFENAESFNQDISNWDISYVRNMRKMFYKAKNFNQDLNNWDIDSEDRPKRKNIFVKYSVAKNPPKWHKWYMEDD